MSNCQVSHSKENGVVVEGGLMTMNGNGTSIHNNGTGGSRNCYGLYSSDNGSTIHLFSPLTLESITNNSGGGNNGGDGTVAIVDNEGTIIEMIQEATEADY